MTNFRTTFRILNKDLLHWFPGHMGKGLKQMQQKLKNVDCVIEVHDSRIPFSGRNEEFKYTISGIRPHLLVLNKKDLVHRADRSRIQSRLKSEQNLDQVIFTNCKEQKCDGVRKILPTVKDLITDSNRYNRAENPEMTVMIIGVPNVGKSSLINVLRNRHLKKKNATAVGAVAGITRSVLNRIKISEEPPIYLIDTPGILEPKVKDVESGLKLALCGCLQDHLVGNDVIADYLLFLMNRQENFLYMDVLGLKEPCDDILKVLQDGATHLQRFKKLRTYEGSIVQNPDIEYAAICLIKAFRQGKFGKTVLDSF